MRFFEGRFSKIVAFLTNKSHSEILRLIKVGAIELDGIKITDPFVNVIIELNDGNA